MSSANIVSSVENGSAETRSGDYPSSMTMHLLGFIDAEPRFIDAEPIDTVGTHVFFVAS